MIINDNNNNNNNIIIIMKKLRIVKIVIQSWKQLKCVIFNIIG
jgi:hypothetical protein